MLAYGGRDRANEVAYMVPVVARERAAQDLPEDWARPHLHDEYVATLNSMQGWVEGPEWDEVVVAGPRMRPDGGHFAHLASEVLDKAAAAVDDAAGPGYTWLPGRIDEGKSGYEARLSWEHKPNLRRMYEPEWLSDAPMVSVEVGGRLFFLDADLQDLAVTVAHCYPHRWRAHSERVYAASLLELARTLRTDTVTARRVAEVVVPDRKFVEHERNEALTILSADEELAIVTGHGPVWRMERCPECGAQPGETCLVSNCQGSWN